MALIIRSTEMNTSANVLIDDAHDITAANPADCRPDPVWFDIIDYLGGMGCRDAQKVISSTSNELTAHFRAKYTTTILSSTLFGCVVEGSTPPLIMRPLCVRQPQLKSGRVFSTTTTYVVSGNNRNSTKGKFPRVRIIKLITAADISAEISSFRNTKLGSAADQNKIPCGFIDMIVDIYMLEGALQVFEVSRKQIATEYTTADKLADKTARVKCGRTHCIATISTLELKHVDNVMDIMIRRMRSNLSAGHTTVYDVDSLDCKIKQLSVFAGLRTTPSCEVAEFVSKVVPLTKRTLFHSQ